MKVVSGQTRRSWQEQRGKGEMEGRRKSVLK